MAIGQKGLLDFGGYSVGKPGVAAAIGGYRGLLDFTGFRVGVTAGAPPAPIAAPSPSDVSQSFVESKTGYLKGGCRKPRRLAARAIVSYALKKALKQKLEQRRTCRV